MSTTTLVVNVFLVLKNEDGTATAIRSRDISAVEPAKLVLANGSTYTLGDGDQRLILEFLRSQGVELKLLQRRENDQSQLFS